MKIKESAENYLEAIHILKNKLGNVRSIDVVNYLEFSKPSVSVAMKHFRENGYIEVDADGYLSLTPAGKEIAERIYERHQLLTKYLIALGVSPEIAQEDACKVEHDLSEETFSCLLAHYNKCLKDAE